MPAETTSGSSSGGRCPCSHLVFRGKRRDPFDHLFVARALADAYPAIPSSGSARQVRSVAGQGVPIPMRSARVGSMKHDPIAYRFEGSRTVPRLEPPRNHRGSFPRSSGLCKLRRPPLSHRGRPMPSGASPPCSTYSVTISGISRPTTIRATQRTSATSASRGSLASRPASLPAATIP